MSISAEFSDDRVYRFAWHTFLSAFGRGRVLFLMLNPSTADERGPDPTVRRCIGFARAWGARWLDVANLYPLRSTDPNALLSHEEPGWVVERNKAHIRDMASHSSYAVAAYGAHPAAKERGEAMVELVRQFTLVGVLGWTKDGHPRHPLYVPKGTEVMAWESGRSVA